MKCNRLLGLNMSGGSRKRRAVGDVGVGLGRKMVLKLSEVRRVAVGWCRNGFGNVFRVVERCVQGRGTL
jgi:hypothetical protein